MLTPIDETVAATGAVAQADKQIAAASSNSNVVLYTVPDGRKAELFFGHEYAYSNGNDYYLNVDVNGTYIKVMGGLSSQGSNYKSLTTQMITLLAGTRVLTRSSNSGNGYIFGVEKDA
tara:strand:+ start:172 stop:525 length:354 start_codon:yes stop_codon:yes gene_type:complete